MTTTTSERERVARLDRGLRMLIRRFSVSERADESCCGTTVAQAAALGVLAEEGPSRAVDLGRRFGVAPSTLSRNLDRMERNGWVERVTDPDDGRAWRLRLTAPGRRAAEGVLHRRVQFAADVLARIPDGRRAATLDALETLVGAVREATEACCPGVFDDQLRPVPRPESRGRRTGR
jgi:DNA-binding MarR family transcriptional regulator